MNVWFFDADYCLQCYSCANSTGQLYTPAQCSANQVNYTCDDPADTCLLVRANYTEYNEEREVQLKACVTTKECKLKGNEMCKESEGKCKYTCCQHDLCNDNSPGGGLAARQCYHCEEPHGSASLVFNHSIPLNKSFTTYQCKANQSKMYCPHGNICGRVYRKFQLGSSDQFVVERRSCISTSECHHLRELCNGTKSVGNATSQCWYRCCDRDLCNSTSCVNLTLFLITFAAIFGVITV